MAVLVDFAWNSLEIANGNMSESEKRHVIDTLSAFVMSRTTLSDCLAILSPLPEGVNVVHRLCDIMRTNSERPRPSLAPQDLCSPPSGKRKKAISWSVGDDNRLIMAVNMYGKDNWPLISRFVGGGRTRGQCSQRWSRVIDPKISKHPWTREDDERLCASVEKLGKKNWMRVAEAMGNRSDVQCRYRYGQLEAGKVRRELEQPEILEKTLPQPALNLFNPEADLAELYEFEFEF